MEWVSAPEDAGRQPAGNPAHGRRRNLTGHWPTYGNGQKAHFHPQVMPDRNWILMTAGDPQTETNHLFLVDISDITDTAGIPAVE